MQEMKGNHQPKVGEVMWKGPNEWNDQPKVGNGMNWGIRTNKLVQMGKYQGYV